MRNQINANFDRQGMRTMPREKKDGHYINCNIERELYEKFEKYAEEMGQTKTTALERILKGFFEKLEKEKGKKK